MAFTSVTELAAQCADEQLDGHGAAQHRQRALAGALNARTAGQPQQKKNTGMSRKLPSPLTIS